MPCPVETSGREKVVHKAKEKDNETKAPHESSSRSIYHHTYVRKNPPRRGTRTSQQHQITHTAGPALCVSRPSTTFET